MSAAGVQQVWQGPQGMLLARLGGGRRGQSTAQAYTGAAKKTGQSLFWGEAPRCLGQPQPLDGRKGRRPGKRSCCACAKMIVPGFGEKSPEAKAAASLHNFFTFLAVKIVLSQLQAYNPEGYQELKEVVDRVPLKDGDAFCAELMRVSPRHKGLALRILEVRSAYAHEDFEWDNLKVVSEKVMDDSNTRLMREYLVETSSFDKVE